uniref:Uncharacterized protein n=1 Tax=Salix viminalis TaxID=40686 RepID=A0A6N2N4H3_SALVM
MGSNPIREHMGNEARLLNSLLCHLKIGIIGFISRGAKDAALYQNQTCTIVPRPFRIRKLVARKWLYQGSCWIAEQSKKANTDQRAYPTTHRPHSLPAQMTSITNSINEIILEAAEGKEERRKSRNTKWIPYVLKEFGIRLLSSHYRTIHVLFLDSPTCSKMIDRMKTREKELLLNPSGSRTQRAQFVRRLKTFRGRRETGGHDPAFDCQNKKEDTKTQLLRDLNKNFPQSSSFGFTALTLANFTRVKLGLTESAFPENSLPFDLKTFLLAAGSSYSLSPPLPTLSSSMDLRMASSERLSQAISKAVDFGPGSLGRDGPKLSPSSSPATLFSLRRQVRQKVSDSKTRIFCSRNVPASLANRLSTGFGFELTNNLGRYWGMPLLHERLNLTRARSGLIRIPSLFPFPPAPFFRNEKEDGTLELYYLSAYCLPKILLLQLVGHRVIQISCVFRGFPMLQLPYQRSEMDWLTFIRSLVLTLMCGIHSRSALGITSSSGWNSSQNPTTSPTLLPQRFLVPLLKQNCFMFFHRLVISLRSYLFFQFRSRLVYKIEWPILLRFDCFPRMSRRLGKQPLVGSPDRQGRGLEDSESELSMPVTLVAFFFVMPFLNFFLDPFPSMGMGGSSPQVKSTFHVIKGACTLIITYLPGSLLAQ